MKIITAIVISLMLYSCTANKENDALNQLFSLMQGSFDSSEQAATDSAYFDISLHMYPIWEERGNFLYVEQAVSSMQDRPYRQRIYEVKALEDGSFASYVYKIPHDSLWIGKWQTPTDFNSLMIEELDKLEGCEVVLQQLGEQHFAGQTGEKSCESVFRGAAYATSEVSVTPGQIASWDRGFDAEGNHVWGAEKGGYIFKSKNPNTPTQD